MKDVEVVLREQRRTEREREGGNFISWIILLFCLLSPRLSWWRIHKNLNKSSRRSVLSGCGWPRGEIIPWIVSLYQRLSQFETHKILLKFRSISMAIATWSRDAKERHQQRDDDRQKKKNGGISTQYSGTHNIYFNVFPAFDLIHFTINHSVWLRVSRRASFMFGFH